MSNYYCLHYEMPKVKNNPLLVSGIEWKEKDGVEKIRIFPTPIPAPYFLGTFSSVPRAVGGANYEWLVKATDDEIETWHMMMALGRV